MSSFTGMDPEAVHAIGTQLRSVGEHLHGIAARIDQILNGIPGTWSGHDAADFQGWWQNQHRPALQSAAGAVSGLGASAVHNATEQLGASGSAAGGGGPGAGAVAAWGPADAAGAARSAWDGTSLIRTVEGVTESYTIHVHGEDAAFQTPGFKQISGGLTVIGVGMDSASVVDGYLTNDAGKMTTGGIGLGLTAVGAVPPLVPVAIAGQITLEAGSQILPVNNEEYAGSYDYALERHFGSGYDPANPTSDQAAWGMDHYSGAGGFFNSVSDGVQFKLKRFF